MDDQYARARVIERNRETHTKRERDSYFPFRTDSLEKLKEKQPEFENVFHDAEQFKEMYKYTFTYAKNRDQKCMEMEASFPSRLS